MIQSVEHLDDCNGLRQNCLSSASSLISHGRSVASRRRTVYENHRARVGRSHPQVIGINCYAIMSSKEGCKRRISAFCVSIIIINIERAFETKDNGSSVNVAPDYTKAECWY